MSVGNGSPVRSSTPGERAHCKRPFYRGEQINLIGAVATNGLRRLWEVTGTVNGAMFTAFIENGLAPKLNPQDFVIMDNLPGHKVAAVRSAIERRGAKVVLLPPYSPDLNPIELLWSKLKEVIRSFAPKTTRAFSRALRAAMKSITLSDIRNWCGHETWGLTGAHSASFRLISGLERTLEAPFPHDHSLSGDPTLRSFNRQSR